MFRGKKSKVAGLVLLVLVLVTGLGAKMYSDVTMGDDEWIGLGASAGRIVFDDQETDEVIVKDAHFGIGLDDPSATLHTFGPSAVIFNREDSGTDNVGALMVIARNSTGTVADGFGSQIRFNLEDDGGVTRQAGHIHLAWSDVSDDESYMAFRTRSGATSEKMRLTHNGKLGLGTTTPNHTVDAVGDIYATGEVCGGVQVSSGGDVFAHDAVVALYGDVTAIFGDVTAEYGEVRGVNVYATSVVSSSGYVYAYTNVLANGSVFAYDDVISLAGNVEADEDVLAGGDVIADGDVTAGGSVFIGNAEDGDEDGARMSLRADNDDGGYVHWTIQDFEGGVYLFEDGNTGPKMALWVQWFTHSDTTGDFTEGDAILIDGPHAQDDVTIASDGAHVTDLVLQMYEGDVYLGTVGASGHTFDVTLLIMWVQD